MQKRLLLLKMLLVALFVGALPQVQAQTYVIDEDNPLITTVSPTGETQLTSNCTWVVTDESNDNNLPENNRAYWSKGDYLGTLIDGSVSTYWHSHPTDMNLETQDEWIQMDFQRDDIQRFYLMIMRREDVYEGAKRYGVTPVKLEIKATNTPDDADSWKTITTLTDIKPSKVDGVWPYYGFVEMGAAYRYVRLYCRQASSVDGEHVAYWTFSELQAFPAKEETDKHEILKSVVDSIYDKNTTYTKGTEPGCVPEEVYNSYMDVFAKVLDINDKDDLDQSVYAQAIADLRQACETLNASIITLQSGWYFIQAGDSVFYEVTGKYRNIYPDADGKLRWGLADENNASQYFIVTKLEDGNYMFQHAYTKQYVNTGAGNAYNDATGLYVGMSDKPDAEQILTPFSAGKFYIGNTKNPLPYNPFVHGDGANADGRIVPASVYNVMSTWTFVPADSVKYASLTDDYTKKLKADSLKDELYAVVKKVVDIKNPSPATGLIKQASQMSVNCAWTAEYGNMALLLDGNHNTYTHSHPTSMNLNTTDEWIQADLGRDDVTSFTVEYWGRNDGAASGNSWHDSPNNIIVKATNTPDDESSWTEITTLDKGFPGNIDNAHYVSLPITTATPYRYYRFIIKSTTSGCAYWNVSEFQLYDKVPASPTSVYTTIAEAKKMIDEIDADVAAALDHINNLTVTGTELDSINAKFDELQKILDDQQVIKDVISEAKALDEKLYAWSADGLIKEVNTKGDGTNQLSANATWTSIGPDNDNYSFNEAFINDGYNLLGTLIDKDDQTYWHSDPTGGNDLRSQENYLQIDLKRTDVKSFRFRVDRRNDLYQGSNRHGVTPTAATIYGTNDDALGNDVSTSCNNWTLITTLGDFPTDKNDASQWPYVSQEITPATPYRYLRFRVTADSDNQPYWCVSGFQVLEGGEGSYDQSASQYYRVDGMKDAADKMMATADALQAKIDNGTATIADTTELKAAMAAVLALYQDTTSLNDLIAKAQVVVDNAETGDDVGLVPDAQLITDLEDAIADAVDNKLTNNSALLKEKTQALQDAYDKLQAAVPSVEAGKWYYILSADDSEDKSAPNLYPARTINGAALYVMNNGNGVYGALLGRYDLGGQLRWGLDDHKGLDRVGDADAMWQFIAAPDSCGKRAYYIQNLHSGLYMGRVNTYLNDYYINQIDEPYPYRIDFIGAGQFNIVPLTGARAGKAISFGDNARQVRADDIDPGVSNRASFTFEEVDPDMAQLDLKFTGNTLRSYTFPFPVSGLEANGDKVKAYGIHSLIDETHVGLVQKNSFAAGEPMLLLLGDTTVAKTDTADVLINMPAADQMTLEFDTVNGLVGTLDNVELDSAGLGYLSKNQLHATTGDAITLATYSNYIVNTLITNMEGEPDAVLTLAGEGVLNKVARVETKADANATVNVYTIDGALVKRNVKAAKATAGLKKGIYIVGKRKVLVK